MGTRIHKALGYGLTDVETKEHRIVDDRFNSFSVINFEDCEYAEERWTFQGYAEWLQKHESTMEEKDFDRFMLHLEIKQINEEKSRNYLDRCFIHMTEFLDPKVLCCIPASSINDWYRFDSTLDYYEERKRDSLEPRVEVMDDPIYPYLNYWDCRDGRKIDAEFSFAFRRLINSGYKFDDGTDKLAQICGFEDSQDCLDHMKPIVPCNLRWLLEYSKIFKDTDSTILEFRPMIYTYWC